MSDISICHEGWNSRRHNTNHQLANLDHFSRVTIVSPHQLSEKKRKKRPSPLFQKWLDNFSKLRYFHGSMEGIKRSGNFRRDVHKVFVGPQIWGPNFLIRLHRRTPYWFNTTRPFGDSLLRVLLCWRIAATLNSVKLTDGASHRPLREKKSQTFQTEFSKRSPMIILGQRLVSRFPLFILLAALHSDANFHLF